MFALGAVFMMQPVSCLIKVRSKSVLSESIMQLLIGNILLCCNP